MMAFNDKTIAVAVGELRNKSEEILKLLENRKVILKRHHKPVAVMLGCRQYEHFNKLLDMAEEYILGVMALGRDKKSRKRDFKGIEKW